MLDSVPRQFTSSRRIEPLPSPYAAICWALASVLERKMTLPEGNIKNIMEGNIKKFIGRQHKITLWRG